MMFMPCLPVLLLIVLVLIRTGSSLLRRQLRVNDASSSSSSSSLSLPAHSTLSTKYKHYSMSSRSGSSTHVLKGMSCDGFDDFKVIYTLTCIYIYIYTHTPVPMSNTALPVLFESSKLTYIDHVRKYARMIIYIYIYK